MRRADGSANSGRSTIRKKQDNRARPRAVGVEPGRNSIHNIGVCARSVSDQDSMGAANCPGQRPSRKIHDRTTLGVGTAERGYDRRAKLARSPSGVEVRRRRAETFPCCACSRSVKTSCKRRKRVWKRALKSDLHPGPLCSRRE